MANDRLWSTRAYLIGLLVAGIAMLLFAGGCNSEQSHVKSSQQTPPPKLEDFPKLQKQLFELATSEKPEEYLKRSNIEYKDGRVQIVIEASGAEWTDDVTWAVEALKGRVETKVDSLIQASVPTDALLKLAGHPRVVFIRLPARPEKAIGLDDTRAHAPIL
ncbi:hypothetical protein HYR54_02700 [Candidatus Acetothermia bacterium]|nr:hypothetical protein [Candidatus Acetothermia bacterium]MBI3459594.1 hypothetical protein [Candidatus Acetothermia bacterium]